ncbi:MAG TPA: non-ribosomal peptide synthetase, partial [Candidatus Acidoferrum sp.]|nr:non-ribosomal peptide synthetase [Candidatus Acidoferrum sp.]
FWELHERSNGLAQYLRNLGAGPGATVALCVERSIDMVAGLLGILKTGAAYVPLDPSYPPQRLGFMLEDSAATIVVAQRKCAAKIPAHSARAVWLDSGSNKVLGEQTDSPSLVRLTSGQRDDTAFVLYTSGSTGTPKGVQGTHRACLNRFAWMWRAYPFQPGEVCCQKTNLGFVDSVWEIFGPLLAGVPNVIIPQETMRDPEELLTTLAREQVTRIVLVPSLLRMLLDHAPQLGERVPRLKLWSSSGEVLPTDLVGRFRASFPAARLLNLYGSSEVAADVTCHEVSDEDLRAGSIPIGRAIANTQVYILDGDRNPVPMGVRGEIYVGGDNLARGYWRRPELTAQRFVENPIAPECSARLYRTGDLGRFRASGDIEYLGRVDDQVKIRGVRIELGEIEFALVGHSGVREAVVAAREDVTGEKRLVAYYTASDPNGPTIEARELRAHLSSQLPDYMVPAAYVRMHRMPLTANGKLDSKALPMPEGDAHAVRGYEAPKGEIEKRLVEIWADVLKVERVGREDNFFELGGHSLLAMRVMARVRHTFDLELPVRCLFDEPTIAALADEVQRAQALGLKGHSLMARGRASSVPPATSREALLSQLDKLSPDEAQTLLESLLDEKHSA